MWTKCEVFPCLLTSPVLTALADDAMMQKRTPNQENQLQADAGGAESSAEKRQRLAGSAQSGAGAGKAAVYFRFSKGSANAVRRSVTMAEFM